MSQVKPTPMSKKPRGDKFEISKEFSTGFAAALIPSPRLLSESDHWLSGWDAGYAFRAAKNEAMNKYLVSIGYEPWGTLKLC